MKKLIAFLYPSFFFLFSVAQNNIDNNKYPENYKDSIEIIKSEDNKVRPPEFIGGMNALKKHIASVLKYPTSALERGVGGIVHVKFTINTDSTVSDITILTDTDIDLVKESIRVVKSTNGKWIPERIGDSAVKANYTVPIIFQIDSYSESGNQISYKFREYIELGDKYCKEKNFEEALFNYSLALTIKPENKNLLLKRAYVRMMLGDNKGADEDKRKAANIK